MIYPGMAADTKVVKELLDHLVHAFEQFADHKAVETRDGLRFVDALMGCHNFYKAVILDLEKRDEDDKKLYRHTAIQTLINGLKMGGHYTQT